MSELREKLGSELIAESIEVNLGERCADFDPGCWTCKAWARLDELDRVEKERDEWSVKAQMMADATGSWMARAEAAESALEQAVRALEFYANPEIYQPHPHGLAFERSDKSYVARSTLSLLKASRRPQNREETE